MLRFSPAAWAKLNFFCHRGGTEIGGFGISRTDDLLAVEDFATVRQEVTAISVSFDDTAVANYFETQVDAGRKPEQFGRLWLHTHPGNCPNPSATDEATFSRVFGGCTWAIMFILARRGETYCRLRFNSGPGGAITIPTEVDFSQAFAGSDHAEWQAEYERNIHADELIARQTSLAAWDDLGSFDDPYAREFEAPLDEDLFDFDPYECEVY